MLKTTFTLPLVLLSLWLTPDRAGWAQSAPEGFNAGPDIITGDMGVFGGLQQFGSNGTQVGLGISTTSCNAGNVPVDFFAIPQTNHPVIPHNLYRMSGGAGNNERFEQIGQSWVKHAFGADQADDCFVCQPGGDFNHLGVGCADTYSSDQNADYNLLGSRAWVNPFTGVFSSNARVHTGHVHTGTSHRILVEGSDLNTTLNQGATYYAEVQYISSDEYAWCQTHPGQCNMYNNASYRRFNVSGTTSFTFSEVGDTVRMSAAINAWTGSTINTIEPAPGVDGRAFIAYKVTGPVAGVWHYEYAIYNENLDRGIQSFTVPLGCGVSVSNLGFHAPPNHPGFPNDGTQGNAGFSNAAWSSEQAATGVTWSSETFAENQNANAIRWGTLYNFRFDSDHAPLAASATIAFFKTGAPVTVTVLGPCEVLPSPTPTATATPAATPPNPTPTASPTAVPSVTPAASPTPIPAAQALNLSTRMRVQTGDNIGIGGFIITGSSSKHVLIRALGPSLTQSGVPNALADPVLELHGPDGFIPTSNDNWRDDPAQEALIVATGIPPTNNLESAIEARLYPGAYTALIMGKNNTSGVGLIEVYDLDPTASSKLADISTRAFVSTGNDIVIAGFVLGGDSADDSVIVRGLGPSLTGSGVANALANPKLELRDENGALLIANNDWQDNAAQAAEINAAGLAPANPLESGIAATLSPGLYTALLTGVNNGTGVGLVEVYDLGAP
jgi:expansin (peptidoglycan-binding protein)